MTHSSINVGAFDRIFAISSDKFTDAKLIATWIETCGVPDSAIVDFIGPTALHYSDRTSLNLGQSFTEPGKVLFINVDNSIEIDVFIGNVQKRQAAVMEYKTIYPTKTFGRFTFNPHQRTPVEYTLIDEKVEPKMTEQIEKLDFNNPADKALLTADIPATENTTLTDVFGWDEAKRLVQLGTPVRRLKHGPYAFVGFNEGKTIGADKFWVEANKEAAIRNGGSLVVKPYYTFCDGESVDMAWRPSMEDELALDWVEAKANIFLSALEKDKDGNHFAHYELTKGTLENGGDLLNHVYPLISSPSPDTVMVIHGDFFSPFVLMSLMTDMKEKLYSKEPLCTTVIEYGAEKPYNSNMVDTHSALAYLDESNWDINELTNEMSIFVRKYPGASFVIDVVSFVKDSILAQTDIENKEQVAVDFVNEIINVLLTNPEFKDNKWTSIDLEATITNLI